MQVEEVTSHHITKDIIRPFFSLNLRLSLSVRDQIESSAVCFQVHASAQDSLKKLRVDGEYPKTSIHSFVMWYLKVSEGTGTHPKHAEDLWSSASEVWFWNNWCKKPLDRHQGSSSDIWTLLNVVKVVVLFAWDSPRFQETLNSSHVKCIKLLGSLGFPNSPGKRKARRG